MWCTSTNITQMSWNTNQPPGSGMAFEAATFSSQPCFSAAGPQPQFDAAGFYSQPQFGAAGPQLQFDAAGSSLQPRFDAAGPQLQFDAAGSSLQPHFGAAGPQPQFDAFGPQDALPFSSLTQQHQPIPISYGPSCSAWGNPDAPASYSCCFGPGALGVNTQPSEVLNPSTANHSLGNSSAHGVHSDGGEPDNCGPGFGTFGGHQQLLFPLGLAPNSSVSQYVNSPVDIMNSQMSLADLLINEFSGELTEDRLIHLLGIGFKVPKICELYNTDEKKVRKFMERNSIKAKNFVDITDERLDVLVRGLVERFPTAGFKMLEGHYRALGVPVSRARLRKSIDRCMLFKREEPTYQVRCTQYSVFSPLSLWHIDGHHKLIRWRFVVHAGIDGFSHIIVFLVISSNNRASTVLNGFMGGVRIWGLPLVVRCDHGLENVGVYDFMGAAREGESVGAITGTSTSNQRIERLWWDVFYGCLAPFSALFYHLEQLGWLDPSNNVDIYVLHVCATTLLQQTAAQWVMGWNHHPLSTVSNSTPYQLFCSGLLEAMQAPGHHPELYQNNDKKAYGEREALYFQDFTAAGERKPKVVVPPFERPITIDQERYLVSTIDPSSVTLSNLIEKYVAAMQLVKTMIPVQAL